MSEFTAHVKGTTKQVASALKGLTGIYATLAKEHGEVSSLLDQAIDTDAEDERAKLMDLVRIELLSHAFAEEETLYDALSRFEQTRELCQHSRTEHQEMERALEEAVAGPTQRALEALRITIQSHVEEEETELFVRADQLLPKTQERELDDLFKQLKESRKRELREAV